MNKNHQSAPRDPGGWTLEDFLDSYPPTQDKDDPWEVPGNPDDFFDPKSRGPSELGLAEESSTSWIKGSDEKSNDSLGETSDPDQEGLNLDVPSPHTDNEWEELRALWDWELPSPSSPISHLTDEVDSSEVAKHKDDDPDPIAEFEPNLGRLSHVLDEEARSLPKTLRIDEWLSHIDQLTESQRKQISDQLKELNSSQFRSWLSWLSQQRWTVEVLCLFLKFSEYWQMKRDWWEGTYWDSLLDIWRPTNSRYSLSRDDQLELVRRRINQPVERVIDERWLDEWNRYVLWEHGFPNFANFALFRAGLSTDDDWRKYVNWDTNGNPLEVTSENGTQRTTEYGSLAWFEGSPVAEAPLDNLGW